MKSSDLILIVPASGFSKRFGEQDKLTAPLAGRPLADYAAALGEATGFRRKIAVVPDSNGPRAQIFGQRGFELVINTAPEKGQAFSIHLGAAAAFHDDVEFHDDAEGGYTNFCVLLADMPLLQRAQLENLISRAGSGVTKTKYQGHSQPPAIFSDAAALAWREAPLQTTDLNPCDYVPLAAPFGDDVDTKEDLARLEKYLQKKRGW